MDALVPALVAVLLAEFGGKNQAIAHRAAMAGAAPGRVSLALAATLIAGLGVSAYGGSLIARMLTPDARLLLAAVALLFAGAPMLLPIRDKALAPPGHLIPSFAIAQFGDSAQFIVFALASRGDMPALATAGGVTGAILASLPPLLLASEWPGRVPLRMLRLIAAMILILAGLILAVQALRLV